MAKIQKIVFYIHSSSGENVNMRYVFDIILLSVIVCNILSCSPQKQNSVKEPEVSVDSENVYDLSDIEESGELIAVTISGPESYFQYRNMELGIEYLLVENYANAHGFRIRMEIAKDTADMFEQLRTAKVDLIAYELPTSLIEQHGFLCVGAVSDTMNASWAVRKTSPLLAASLDEWYVPNLRQEQKSYMRDLMSKPRVQHSKMLKPYVPLRKGMLSPYDNLFAKSAVVCGWDWRLLAAQCYQESAFDPKAVSWAGARGLMQIMPGTANQLGVPVSSLYEPEVNISASVKYLRILQQQFADIKNPTERIKFVLAAYNGGSRHVRDAMALARKNHQNPYSWHVVSYYILHLSEPRFYKDPVVQNGYMIGSETYNYVNTIMARWSQFKRGVTGKVIPVSSSTSPIQMMSTPLKSNKRNRFTGKSSQIIPRSDSIFKLQN